MQSGVALRLPPHSKMMLTGWSLVAFLILVLPGLYSSQIIKRERLELTQHQFPATLKPCRPPHINEDLLCGKLSVFENRKTRVGRKIDLNVVVLPALEPRPNEAPLFDFQGGPGIADTSQATWYAGALKEYRRHRDVVLVDQRGTGLSNPLQCGTEGRGDYLDEMYPIKYVEACRKKLEQVADLTQYTTPIAMDDLDDVRAWLGYDKINLIGLSYGTRAALVYIRQHPEHVRSAVLMGVAPTNSKLPLYHARNAEWVMRLLFADCAADEKCAKAYPNLRQDLDEVLEKLQRQPAVIDYTFPVSKKQVVVTIHKEVFAEQLRNQLYSPESAMQLPFIIHRAAQGDFNPFLKTAIHYHAPGDASDFFIADGMYLSVTCAEDVPFIDPKLAESMNRNTSFGNYRVEQQTRACKLWPRGKVPADYANPVSANVPLLILSGTMDPVTPPEWAAEVASHFPNSLNVVIRHQAHLPDGLTNIDCFDRVALTFLERGTVKDLDISCLAQMMPPPFFVP